MNAGVQMSAMVKVDALLPLMAVSPHVDHELACHPRRHAWTMMLLDEVERHVDAGGDAGTGDHRAILNEETIAHYLGARKFLLHLIDALPMRGAAAAIEQSSLAQHE